MKIAILGAAGVRSPLLLKAILKRQKQLGLTDLALMDLDGERLELIGTITARQEMGATFKITRTTDARAALTGADFVLTTFRVGGTEARVVDERVPLRRGVLGQETTGPGGFAMALRSIPAILEYAELLDRVSPGAWLYGFTNPAGLVTQALRDAGFSRTVGICDGANVGHDSVAAMPARDRFLAWIYTGPVGHLYGTVADLAQLWFLYLMSLAKHRLSGDGGLSS